MELGLLYSAGKDSTLAALLLDSFYDVTLVTARFGVTDAHEHAREAAAELGFPFRTLDLDGDVAHAAAGYPRHAIQDLHERALEAVAGLEFDAVGDGTRRDDRVPTVERPLARSVEDRHGIDYVAPLRGFGRGAVDALVDRTVGVEAGPSETVPAADYEAAVRALVAAEHGQDAVEDVFPAHDQSRVHELDGE
jgi:predicted subunit of tRNA(5-methylaminomethyl-2-thiouridylate) methyltransferase